MLGVGIGAIAALAYCTVRVLVRTFDAVTAAGLVAAFLAFEEVKR